MKQMLDVMDAYLIMYKFLERRWKKEPSDDLRDLLGCMPLLMDGLPVDSAVWVEWNESVEKIIKVKVLEQNKCLTVVTAYEAMKEYINLYRINIQSTDMANFLIKCDFFSEIVSSNLDMWIEWMTVYREFVLFGKDVFFNDALLKFI